MGMAYLEEWEKPVQMTKEKKTEAKREKRKEKRKNGGPPTHPLYSPLRTNGPREFESS